MYDGSIKCGVITSPVSDHLPVFMCLNRDSQPKSPTPNLTRCFSSLHKKIYSLLKNIDTSLISNETLSNVAFELLKEICSQAFNQSFPLQVFPPYYNIRFTVINHGMMMSCTSLC